MIVARHDVLRFADATDPAVVGGKAINLQRLAAAGFPVPDGFVVTTHAYREAVAAKGMPAHLVESIRAAYQRLGSPAVAVRSSATAEDLADSSMAGQYETVLDVQGEEAVLAAISRCWASVASARVASYLAERGIAPAAVAMAVVVQRLVRAEVAGVLFTANPRTGARHEMVVDAAWGLGEAVVSGLVQPDSFTLDRATGTVLACTVGDKHVAILPGDHAPRPMAEERRRVRCLDQRQLRDLWRLGTQVLDRFGCAQDIEWAIEDDRVFLLQTRAITTLEDAEAYQERLSAVRAQLAAAAGAGRGPWVAHNLGETVPHPHPLSWSVLARFMSGAGGYGRLYRRLGYAPSAEVDRDGFLDLVGGRIYLDCARGPGLFLDGFPFAYDLDELRRDPDAAQRPPSRPVGGFGARLSAQRRLAGVPVAVAALAASADRDFTGRDAPAFTAWVAAERTRDLAALNADGWWACWQEREQRVLDDFAPLSLLPSVLAVWALDELRAFLAEHVWDEDPDALVRLLAVGGHADSTVRANQGMFGVAEGRIAPATWLVEHGHRGVGEFDLAALRWDEQPERLTEFAARLAGGNDPAAAHARRAAAADDVAQRRAAALPLAARAEFARRLELVRRYTPFREDGKDVLMRGYRLLRDLALDAGRRLEIGDDIFLLTREELRDAVAIGFAPLHLIERRRLQRAAEARLRLPAVIASSEITAIGAAAAPAAADRLAGAAISPGQATGPVRIVRSPLEAGDLGRGYVLVCPSTDPSWTPLMINAAAIVIERGGTLSHGAVVARELGVPAVVVPDACARLAEGEAVVVDGDHGVVARACAPAGDDAATDTTAIAWARLPPRPGAGEARSARWRDASFLGWTAFLVAFFLLPEPWLKQPIFAVLDAVLLPLVPRLGPAGTVAAVAVALAVLTLGLQRLATDNRRLVEAKRRAAVLRTEAERLPVGSVRRAALLAAAAPINGRVTMAAMVPLALLLGPLVVSFMWLPERLDVAAWNPPAGSIANVRAVVAGDSAGPVRLEPDAACALAEESAAEQAVPPIRATLEELRAQWREPMALDDLPWGVRAAAQHAASQMRADLDGFLAGPMPDRVLEWRVELPLRDGSFPVTVGTGGDRLSMNLVAGHGRPPEPRLDLSDGRGMVSTVQGQGALRSLSVMYKEPTTRGAFWQPFTRLGWGWDAGWLGTYLIAYLPAMLLVKRLLRVA